MPKYRITVNEHRLYRSQFEVEADSPEEAEELLEEWAEGVVELGDEMVDCTDFDIVECVEIPDDPPAGLLDKLKDRLKSDDIVEG